MDGLKFIHQLIIILGFSLPVIYIFKQGNVPSISGFLIAGILIGPFGLKLIDDTAGIHFLAELGGAFLLFSGGIGMQFSRSVKNVSEVLPSDLVLQPADQLILFGSHSAIDSALKILGGEP